MPYEIWTRSNKSLTEITESWRTVGRARSKGSPGVYPGPSGSANRAANQPSYNGHSFTEDAGHSFSNLKVQMIPGGYTYTPKGSIEPSRVSKNTVPKVILPDRALELYRKVKPTTVSEWKTDGLFWPSVPLTGFALLESSLAKSTTGMFTSSIPGPSEMGWGETVVELLRGNHPKLLADLASRIKKGRELDPRASGKDLGSEYLNLRFGIEPIVKDMHALALHLTGVTGMMYDDFKRRRETKTHFVSYGNNTVQLRDHNWVTHTAPDTVASSHYLFADSRLAAAFTKAKPTGALRNNDIEKDEVLRTLGLNARLPWDLLPYTWLVDWAGNIGSAISNFAAFAPSTGRFKTRYAWVTDRYRSLVHIPSHRTEDRYGTKVVSSCSYNLTHTYRHQVSPFGIHFSPPQLSGYQWSILVALGLAKSAR